MRRRSRPLCLLLALLVLLDVLTPAGVALAQEVGVSGEANYLTWTPWITTHALPDYYFQNRLYPIAGYPTVGLKLPMDPRVLQIRVDPEDAEVATGVAAADVPIGPERVQSFEEYAQSLTVRNLRNAWVDQSRARINRIPTETANRQTGLSIALPVELPSTVQSILGRGAPSINVSGSERISISGRSNWTNQQNVFGRGQSLFPQLDMRQDLQINLSGNLGDKVSVDVAQSSGAQTSLANRVALRYTGYEDEVIKRLQLGNTQLSLPGTQYVSYSGRNDGLFGLLTEAQIGSTDLTFVASKQEARSERANFIGTSLTRSVTIDDWEYIERTYYLLQFPDSVTTPSGDLRADKPDISIGTIEVFVDDRIDQNLGGEQPGYAELRPPRPGTPIDSVSLVGRFDRKEPIRDYSINLTYFGAEFPVLIMNSAIPPGSAVGIQYTDSRGQVGETVNDSLRLQLIKVPESELVTDQEGNYVTDPAISEFAPTREYELRSFYNLGASNLDPATTELQVRRLAGGGQLEFVESFTSETTGQTLTYLEVTGIDLLDQTQGGTAVAAQDGIVDQATNATWVDWEQGILYFPDLRPFAPRLDRPGDLYFSKSRAQLTPPPTRRAFLSNDPTTEIALQGNPGAYNIRNNTDRRNARTFQVFIQFTSSSGNNTIILQNSPVLEGTEIVSVNGETLTRDSDYSIDYQSGIVTLLSERARAGGGQLSIDYSYAPLFAQASRTLVGSSVGLIDRQNLGLGGAFIFESRGRQERRPRIGEEPSRSFIGDVHGRFSLTPGVMTSIANMLPFYRGREPSRLSVSGEVGHSIPNPNTQNEVYIDDFEGTRITAGASMDARSWFPSSVPEILVGAAPVPVSNVHSNAELKYFNPFNVVREGDLRPTLTRAEDRDAPVTALSWWVPQKYSGAAFPTTWFGITQPLDNTGLDLSRSQFIDLWINDFRNFAQVRKAGVRLNIDLGIVSEDAQLWPDTQPNGQLNTEDQEPRDGQLDASEDTGVDSVFSISEGPVKNPTARLNASTSDPNGDDFRTPDEAYENERDPRRWRFNNGTENNLGYRGIPDTEDLDKDGILDIANNFFRYSFDLTDTTFLDTDVYRDFAGDPNVTEEVRTDNGWRRFLIPLDADTRELFGSPDLHNIKQVRIWLEGIDDLPPLTLDPNVPVNPLFEIAQLEIVGNRWAPQPVDDVAESFGQQVVVRTVNNREDEAVYEPPPGIDLGSQNVAGSTVTEREQSLALRAANIVPGGEVSAFRTTTLPENYSRYRAIRFYLASFDFSPADTTRFFIRFSSDAGNEERNFYEYSVPITNAAVLGTKPVPWQEFDLPITEFSGLKIGLSNDVLRDSTENVLPNGGIERFLVQGRPSFTRIQRVTIGLENALPPPADSLTNRTLPGEIWIDELRAVDIDREQGTAGRVAVSGNFSDLATFGVGVDRQDPDFRRLGQDQGTGNDFLSTRLSTTIRGEKLLPARGFQLPVALSYNRTRSKPLFRTGQDIRLEGADSEREKTESWSRSMNFSISHSGSRNWLLRNTLDALSFSYSMSDAKRLAPTTADTSRTLSGRGSYSLQPAEWFSLPIPFLGSSGRRPRFNILPVSTSLSFSMTTRRNIVYNLATDGSGDLVSRNGLIYSKSMLYTLSAAFQPIPILDYSLSSTRNANIPGIEPSRVAGVNFGRQTAFNQRINLRIPIRIGAWLSPEFDVGTVYNEARGPELSPNLSLGNFSNSTTMNVRYTLPFQNLGGPARPSPADTSDAGGFRIPIGDLLSRLGNIQTRASFSRNTSYTLLEGYPSIAYRLGIAREPGFEPVEGSSEPSVKRTSTSTDAATRNLTGEANTNIRLWGRATARVRGNVNHLLRTNNTRAFVTQTVNLPDLTLDWGPVQNLLRLSGIFPTLTANTRFNRTINTDGEYKKPINSRTVNRGWQPILSLQGTTKSGIQTSLSADWTSSLRQDFRNSFGGGRSTDTESNNMTFRSNLSKTFTPGSRLGFLGLFGSTLRTTVTLSLSGSFNKRTGGTKVPGTDRIGSPIDNDRFEMQSSGTYTFSRNISGTVSLGFSQFRDFTRNVTNSDGEVTGTLVQRSIRLEASAVMRF